MEINAIFSERHQRYDAPAITTLVMIVDNILCYSTEKLQEDDFDPWA